MGGPPPFSLWEGPHSLQSRPCRASPRPQREQLDCFTSYQLPPQKAHNLQKNRVIRINKLTKPAMLTTDTSWLIIKWRNFNSRENHILLQSCEQNHAGLFFFNILLIITIVFFLPTWCANSISFNTFITSLYTFDALLCSSSGGKIVLVQHLVSSLRLFSTQVKRGLLGSPLFNYVLNSHLKRVTIPDAVLIKFYLLRMSIIVIETCRGM